MINTYDNGYILMGHVFFWSISKQHIFLIKTDSTGNIIWAKTIGEWDYVWSAWDIIQTSDTNIILVGYPYGLYASIIIKFDMNGNSIWSKKYQSPNDLIVDQIIEDSSGDYVLTGCNRVGGIKLTQDIAFLKIDKNGNVKDFKLIKDTLDYACGTSIIDADNGEYLVAGFIKLNIPEPSIYFYFAKLDSTGNAIFTKSITAKTILQWGGKPTIFYDKNNKNYTILGPMPEVIINLTQLYDIAIFNIFNNGTISWAKYYGKNYSSTIWNQDYYVTQAGEYLVVGTVIRTDFVSNNIEDIFIVKFDSLGNTIWYKELGDDGNNNSVAILETTDSNITFLGTTEGPAGLDTNTINLHKINQDGSPYCYQVHNDFFSFYELDTIPIVNDIQSVTIPMEDSITVSNFPVLIADINYFTGDVCDTITGIISETNLYKGDILLYPNPVTANHVNIQYRLLENSSGKMEIYDLMGHKVDALIFTEDAGIIEFDLSHLPKGLYFYTIIINNEPYKIDKLIVE